jgi:hypothetical protein
LAFGHRGTPLFGCAFLISAEKVLTMDELPEYTFVNASIAKMTIREGWVELHTGDTFGDQPGHRPNDHTFTARLLKTNQQLPLAPPPDGPGGTKDFDGHQNYDVIFSTLLTCAFNGTAVTWYYLRDQIGAPYQGEEVYVLTDIEIALGG